MTTSGQVESNQTGGTASRGGAPRTVPPVAHVALVTWVVFFLALAEARPLVYDGLLQEDRFVEWLTVALFAAAACFALQRALRERRVFDGLVGAFCVFVAGEEFSWGQRLLGITPPAPFLEHNRQQELTLHNFADAFGEPKWILIVALTGFGLLLPAIAAAPAGERVLRRSGASVPSVSLAAWFIAAAVLLLWYPHSFTGEWVEALAGGAFLLAFMPSARAGLVSLAGAATLALALTLVSARGRGVTPAELACAHAETTALLQDLAYGSAATGRLAGASSVHKRVFTAIEEGYVERAGLESFGRVACPGDDDAPDRRRHAIDPWGTAYWIDIERADRRIHLAVYSFGPNRRRDPAGTASGDDVRASLLIDPLAAEAATATDNAR